MAGDYGQRCRDIAKRFLLTAAVVDDEPFFENERVGSLRTPGRSRRAEDGDAQEGKPNVVRQTLDAKAITESFAEQGMICGIVVPYDDGSASGFFGAVRRADVVVVDWQLRRDDGKKALELLRFILDEDQGDRLRLIAIYTGETDLVRIRKTVADELKTWGMELRNEEHSNNSIVLSRGHCRIVVYAKWGVDLPDVLSGKSVSEEHLAERLIGDFSAMVEGLLPSIALTALAAVRENAHKLLDKFEATLDAAYLTHRSCLPAPDESEQHMVEQVASELHGIMDDAVAERRPAGDEAIDLWLRAFKREEPIVFESGKRLRQNDIRRLVGHGLDTYGPPFKKGGRDRGDLTSGFSRKSDGDSEALDLKLASMMCFRTVFDKPRRVLRLGTAVKKGDAKRREYFLCMRPRCDSVRITGQEAFLLVPLADGGDKAFQIVVPTGDRDQPYRLVGVDLKMSEWRMVSFEANSTLKAVVANEESGGHYFNDVKNVRYEWIGELKPDFAQGVANELASGLSRVALNKSEWLRRSEKR